jgi:hypothetical protein
MIYGKFTASNPLSNYEEKFFSGTQDELKANIGKLHIVRNCQLVACIEMVDGFKISSSRSTADANMKTVLHKTELSYYTKSNQDNRMDIAIGIQENKNQHCGDLPKNLIRLIVEIKTMRYYEIIDYFQLKCKEKIDAITEAERLESIRLQAQQLEEERLEAERLEAERLEAERLETERLEAERLEDERLESERLEAERLEAERLEAERLEAERPERERLEAERLEAERLERIVRIGTLEEERLEYLRLEYLRLEAERLEAERLEAERLEAERVELERLEAERLARLEPVPRPMPVSVQLRVSVELGISILTKIREENNTTCEEIIDDMLIDYSDRCAPDQIKPFIKYIPFIRKIDLLLELINKQYQYNKTVDMKDGSRLYKFVNNI